MTNTIKLRTLADPRVTNSRQKGQKVVLHVSPQKLPRVESSLEKPEETSPEKPEDSSPEKPETTKTGSSRNDTIEELFKKKLMVSSVATYAKSSIK